MKVVININNDTLIAVHKLLQKVYDMPLYADKRQNVYKSIGYDLADRFQTKYQGKIRKSDLFDQKKLTKFTLKFHEAWALQEILVELKPHSETELDKTLVQNLINTLDQKTV